MLSIFSSRLKKIQGQIDFEKLPKIHKKRHKIQNLLNKHSTPLFIADKEILTSRLNELKKALKKNWGNYKIAYSFKTNYEVARINVFKKENLWAEVVSGREYQMAKNLGYKGNEIIFNGPYKKDSELSLAFKDGALVNIDNFDELERIIKIAKRLSIRSEVGIRVNTEIPYLPRSRFGFSIEGGEAKEVLKTLNAAKNLKLTSIHIHIGTDIDKPLSYHTAARNLCNFIKGNIDDYQKSIKYLNFGGGFPASGLPPYGKSGWKPKPIENYILAITKEAKKLFSERKKPTLIIEPGRYLVDDSVVLISKVIGRKLQKTSQSLVVDATINMLPLLRYRPAIVKAFDDNLNKLSSDRIKTKVYGATCQETDILFDGRLPASLAGSYLIFYVVGAYNQNMASEFIFKKPKTHLMK